MFKHIIAIGVTQQTDPHEVRKIRLLNSMCLMGVISFAFLFLLNVLRGVGFGFMVPNLTGQLILLFTFFLQSKGHFQTARWFVMVFLLLFFNTMAVLMGPKAGIEFLDLLICISPLVFFDRIGSIVVMAALSLTGFLTARALQTFIPVVMKNEAVEVIFWINMCILFTSCFLMLFFYRNELLRYNQIMRNQNRLLEERNKEMQDSVRYASRIQHSMIRFDEEIKSIIPESFVYYQPRDVVSGDFYWFSQVDGKMYGVCADCTGHGIPGAFMCMIGITLLNEIIIEKKIHEPNRILDELHHSLMRSLRTGEDGATPRDGMELALVVYDPKLKQMQFSGAYAAVWIVRKDELMEIEGDLQPIGWFMGAKEPFTSKEIQLQKGDQIYLFTDGYPDQIGGAGRGKKFLYSRFRKLLLDIRQLPMHGQKHHIEQSFLEWKGDQEQIDDICVIGLRVS